MKKFLIFFDFDGTLVNSIDAHILAFNESFLKNGLPVVPKQKIEEIFGLTSEKIIRKLFKNLSRKKLKKVDEDKNKLFVKKYHKQVKIFPNVNKVLKKLREKAYLVLESNASINEIKKIAKFAKLNLKNFDLILSKEKVKKEKPSSEIIKKAEKVFGKLEKYVVGDSYLDLLLAKNGKARSILFINQTNKNNLKKLLRYKPDFIIHDIKDILKIIK
jgi:phosphoglycolate phosphatase